MTNTIVNAKAYAWYRFFEKPAKPRIVALARPHKRFRKVK